MYRLTELKFFTAHFSIFFVGFRHFNFWYIFLVKFLFIHIYEFSLSHTHLIMHSIHTYIFIYNHNSRLDNGSVLNRRRDTNKNKNTGKFLSLFTRATDVIIVDGFKPILSSCMVLPKIQAITILNEQKQQRSIKMHIYDYVLIWSFLFVFIFPL